jgi:hypothetical protein
MIIQHPCLGHTSKVDSKSILLTAMSTNHDTIYCSKFNTIIDQEVFKSLLLRNNRSLSSSQYSMAVPFVSCLVIP